MTLMKVYLKLLLFVLYVTDEGVLVTYNKNINNLKYTFISDIQREQ
jgi:hypothetical protein